MNTEEQLAALGRQLLWLKVYALCSGVLLVALALSTLLRRERDVIRARGLVLLDEAGRERILLGTPVPESRDRVRTDLEKVRRAWAPRLGGDSYLEAYKGYENRGSGLVFLNERGYDKLVLGEDTPDPNTGRRQVKAAGLTWNDDEGFERGGVGISRTPEGGYRVVLGMDDSSGEAVHLFISEDGSKGLRIGYEDGQLLVGRARANNSIFGNTGEFSGVVVKDKEDKVLWEHNSLQQGP